MGTRKKPNLAEVFKENEEKRKPQLEVVETALTEKKVAPSREKKKHIGGYFDEPAYRQMKHLGVENSMTTQDILKEALNAFFRMHDKPPIA